MGSRHRDFDDDDRRSLKRIESQLLLEGRLDRAVQTEDFALLLLPFVLVALAILNGTFLRLGLEPEAVVILSPAILVGTLVGYLWWKSRQ